MEMTDLVAAESAIRQLHARYVDALWRRDTEAFVECFAADAEWKIAGLHMRGRGEIGSQFERFIASSERILMVLTAPVLEVGEGTATSRTFATEYVKLKDGRAVRTLGIYYDRLIDQGERWRFQRRHFNLYHYGPLDLSADFHDCLEYGPPPGMPGPDDPTTVRSA